MKTFSIILTAAITAILFAAGCVNEEPAYKNEPGTTPAPEDGTGYLSMAGMTMRVIYDDQTDTQPDDTSSETVKPQTRAEEAQPDVDEFIVEIFDAEGTSVYKDTYANLRTETAATDGKMELPTGSYKLEVRSEEPSSKLADWDHPVYFAARDFAIEKNEDTVLEEIVCTLSNIKVTLTCSKDLADQFTAETISTVSLGETSMVFVKGETRAAYFTSLAELNTLKFNLTGAFAETPETPLQFNKEIPNVKAGQWRKITLVITYADKGGIKFDIDVKNLLNSTCKCNRILINNLFKFFVWREVSKSFTRSIIEFIFNPLNLFVGYFTKVLTLWDILPDKPVGVFIGTTFP